MKKERQIVNTNIRLNLANEADRRAWEYLQRMDRKRYKSYSKAFVAALNDYFDRQERLIDDPYLETREKEEAFLRRVLDTIERGLQASAPVGAAGGPLQLLRSVQPISPVPELEISSEQEEANDAALDFADCF